MSSIAAAPTDKKADPRPPLDLDKTDCKSLMRQQLDAITHKVKNPHPSIYDHCSCILHDVWLHANDGSSSLSVDYEIPQKLSMDEQETWVIRLSAWLRLLAGVQKLSIRILRAKGHRYVTVRIAWNGEVTFDKAFA